MLRSGSLPDVQRLPGLHGAVLTQVAQRPRQEWLRQVAAAKTHTVSLTDLFLPHGADENRGGEGEREVG